MSGPLIQDFSIISGDDTPIDATLNANITGASVTWFMKQDISSTTILLTKDTAGGKISVTNAITGAITFTLSAAETASLSGSYYYEIETVDALGKKTTFTTGTITAQVGKVSLSYATVDYADNYFADVLFPEPWFQTDAATKIKALRMATKKIDSQMLIGRKVDLNQTLQFPRAIYSDTRTLYKTTVQERLRGVGFYNLPGWIAEVEIHQDVKDATCEEALALLKHGANANKRAELQRQGVKSFGLGPLSESFTGGNTGNKLLSATASQLLARYLGGGRTLS